MTISFIITTYNILPYIGHCLDSVAAVARAGDEVILVDDGSNDGTVEHVQAFAAQNPFAEGVTFKPIYLGTNTMGGVGIGANIGLNAASCDTVFFVDGDDWVDIQGFNKARAHWTLHPSDILFTNYLEFDQSKQATKKPADFQKWSGLDRKTPLDTLRAQALTFIAVPWRKFYRRDFLEAHKLRFPEGDFFFEDNPFHWAVCMKAETIGFLNTIICYHRINRPGQTMASTGIELTAFFTHFDTILNNLPDADDRNLLSAARWLLSNMSWHVGRLSRQAYYSYGTAASKALQSIPDALWQNDLAATEAMKSIWPIANRLRSGDINGQIDAWQRQAIDNRLGSMNSHLQRLQTNQGRLQRQVLGQIAADSFESIQRRRRVAMPLPPDPSE
ncbi:glycosyltransferase family 2 protein [Paracoccus sp. 11-3]|uniref:Glycosyltransferase family 2 protein n=1 Tax=Paracoccus amoyensis TaxID=2760093 RepID=A0A926J7N3_9RHOB|nr:glycosyltransferase family 2 protein [Paracoccus amoyensis]MBC9248512.1 glycosyltransferase family 2 protein [Paracoccus amoyensis]